MEMKISVLMFLFYVIINIEGANILSVFPLPLYSHTNTFMPVLKELHSRGHNITMLSPYPQKNSLNNWTDIVVDKKPIDEFLGKAVIEFSGYTNIYVSTVRFWGTLSDMLVFAYQDKAFQKLIQDDNSNFDLVIAEPLFLQESLVAFGHKFNAPVVAYNPLALSPWASYLTANPLLLPYVPNFRTSYTDNMTFIEKLNNIFLSLLELVYCIFVYFPKQERYMDKYMIYTGSDNRPTLNEMLKNISIHLIDYHYSVGYVQPLQPNTIPVGGLSLRNSAPLPEDLQKYMDSAPNGIIYLSFGSHMPVSSLDQKSLNAILTTFRNLEINVLMKWEIETLVNKPGNVETRKWLPQASILAHPKCRLFITHGGIHGITEASYYGVPVLVIPFFSDQEFNAIFVQKMGFGYLLHKEDISAKFQSAIELLLNDKSYNENAEKRSQITRDRPMSALDTSVYWIEYVLRHKDVSHLQPGGLNLSLFQLFLYDVVFVLLLTLFLLIFVAFVVSKCLSRFISRYIGISSKKKKE